VDELEERYPQFPGLNLSFEVREAFIQHSGRRDTLECAEFIESGAPLLEAQIADVADSIAYDTHDTDDALGLGFITLDELTRVEFWTRATERVRDHTPGLSGGPLRVAVVRELLAWQVADLLDETANRLTAANVKSISDVRTTKEPLVGFTPEVRKLKAGLERFLHERVYKHHRVLRMTANGKRILQSAVRGVREIAGTAAGKAPAPLDRGRRADRPAPARLGDRRTHAARLFGARRRRLPRRHDRPVRPTRIPAAVFTVY